MQRRHMLATLSGFCLLPFRAKAADTLSVLLDWFVNPNHAPLVVAEQIGAFSRRGLNVNLVQSADPTTPAMLVAAGHADMAISYQATLYRQVLNGLPLLRIGALQDRSLVSLCAIDGQGIKTLADLKGKKIGYNEVGGDVTLACIDRMLQSCNLSLADIQTVNVGSALTTSLLTGRIDSVTIVRNFETFEIENAGRKPLTFDYEAYGVPPLDGLIYVIQRERAGDSRFPRFLDAVREATAYLRAHPKESWKLFLRSYPDLDNTLNRNAWNYTLAYFATEPARFDRAKYAAFAQFLVDRKILAYVPNAETYAVELGTRSG